MYMFNRVLPILSVCQLTIICIMHTCVYTLCVSHLHTLQKLGALFVGPVLLFIRVPLSVLTQKHLLMFGLHWRGVNLLFTPQVIQENIFLTLAQVLLSSFPFSNQT